MDAMSAGARSVGEQPMAPARATSVEMSESAKRWSQSTAEPADKYQHVVPVRTVRAM
jgi:hypothetical protein